MSEETVLIVDDEETVLHSHKLHLETEYEVLTATSGEECFEKLDENIDVLLLDRMMPGISGDEVLDEIRNDEDLCDMNVIMVTAVEPGEDFIDLDFDDYLMKPVTGEELRRSVKTLLVFREYRQTLQECYALMKKKSMVTDDTEKFKLQDQIEDKQDELMDIMSRMPKDIKEVNSEIHSIPELRNSTPNPNGEV